MIYCKSLNKEFSSKEELFSELKKNENRIISIKKAQVYKSVEKGQLSIDGAYIKDDSVSKVAFNTESGFVYPVINTTWYLDHHDDVHKTGLWKKTIKDNIGKIYYVSGHKFDIDNVITWPEDVEVITKIVPWNMVGKNYEGTTEALIFKIAEENITKESAKNAIKGKRKVQGSVSMMYVKIDMAVDSKDKEFILNKQIWDDNIDMVANKDKAIEQGYFFLVSEAKIVREGSLVLAGSNDATEIIYHQGMNPMDEDEEEMKIQPDNSTEEEIEAVNDTSKEFIEEIINFKFI